MSKGTQEKQGFDIGIKLSEDIKHNILLQNKKVKEKQLKASFVEKATYNFAENVSSGSLKMMEGMSLGSNIPFESILRFNALQGIITLEECTTFAAIGEATSNGKTVLLKNRDKSGNREFQGSGYYKKREINVVQILKTDDGNLTIGVTISGSIGIMMGLNKYGLAVASNAGAMKEVSEMSPKQLHAISGRPQMLREGLECKSATEAVNLTLQKLTKAPMGSPGMLFFADANDVYVVEGGCVGDLFAVQHFKNGALSRSNHFEILGQLNNQRSISAICRKIRAQELIKQNYGKINCDVLKTFSMDHINGPRNSICSHSHNPEDSVTVSAAIMEIDHQSPQKSRISIALGSPCWAWRSENSNFTFQMDNDTDLIPAEYISGASFADNYKAEPFGGGD